LHPLVASLVAAAVKNMTMISTQANYYKAGIIDLLRAEGLPTDDLPQKLENFVLSIEEEGISGVCGLEIYSKYGLLRSLAVVKTHCNKGIAGQLIRQIEQNAVSNGLRNIYLLTETASAYFLNKGYENVARENVPEEIKQSTEFSHVCPVSAIVMKKDLK